MPRSRLLIIADDLTGSADSGVFFARRGLRTTIALDGSGPDPDDPVLIVDTDSREADARTAQALTAAAIREHATPDRLLFVKIDSTLRGPVGAVVGAIGAPILCAPAFPAAGRTTVAGRQLDAGRPLRESPAWHGHPGPTPADIAAALAPVRATTVDLVDIADPVSWLAGQFAAGRAVICDAATDADLTRIARAGLAVTPTPVFVGTGGLAAALARELPAGAGVASVCRSGPALVVVGSASGTAREQAQSLAAEGFTSVVLPALDLAAGRSRVAAVAADTVVSVGGPVQPADRARVVAGLAAAVAPAARRAALLGLTGGQTARAVLSRAGARALRLQDEVDPGVVLSQVDWGGGTETTLITKAGGFGDATTLVRALRRVRTKG